MVAWYKKCLTADFEIVTPMFLGDADRAVSPYRSIVPSLKGAWRFWWRALTWPRLFEQHRDPRRRLAALRDREVSIFGGPSGNGGRGGQSRIAFGYEPPPPRSYRGRRAGQQGDVLYAELGNAGLRYLGFGLVQPAAKAARAEGELLRDALAPGQTFRVSFSLHPELQPEMREELLDSLKLLGLLGGLGARTRRGFGSVKLTALTSPVAGEGWEPSYALDGYREDLSGLIEKYRPAGVDRLPLITAFSRHSLVQLKTWDGDWQSLMNWAGRRMLDLRSWGYAPPHGGPNLLSSGEQAKQLFEDDHDFAHHRGLEKGRRAPRDFVPQRAVFGLPHRYEKKEPFAWPFRLVWAVLGERFFAGNNV